ncbi:MAG: tyrosine-type recombinase/integrase [Gammaproteobacteria bacterium]|nr:tyrosine-type recombinase/integrase [Gammaproteobacteria bacterium]
MKYLTYIPEPEKNAPWNKGKLIGQRPPLKQSEVWSIRTRLEIAGNLRDLTLFNLAIDSKLRGSDLTKLRVRDVFNGSCVQRRALIRQQKTNQTVQFEITPQTQESIYKWIIDAQLQPEQYLFKSRVHSSKHLSTRQYSRIVKSWVKMIGLDPKVYSTHSMRRTKATLRYKRTKNLRAIELLLGHKKIESTVRYLGVEVDDALEMAEQIEV